MSTMPICNIINSLEVNEDGCGITVNGSFEFAEVYYPKLLKNKFDENYGEGTFYLIEHKKDDSNLTLIYGPYCTPHPIFGKMDKVRINEVMGTEIMTQVQSVRISFYSMNGELEVPKDNEYKVDIRHCALYLIDTEGKEYGIHSNAMLD